MGMPICALSMPTRISVVTKWVTAAQLAIAVCAFATMIVACSIREPEFADGWGRPDLTDLSTVLNDGLERPSANEFGTHIPQAISPDGTPFSARLLVHKQKNQIGLFIFSGNPKIDSQNPYFVRNLPFDEFSHLSLFDNRKLDAACTKERIEAMGICEIRDYPKTGFSISLGYQVFFIKDRRVQSMFISD
jgi:hypothetical protein